MLAGSFCTMERDESWTGELLQVLKVLKSNTMKFNIKTFQDPKVKRNEPHYQW